MRQFSDWQFFYLFKETVSHDFPSLFSENWCVPVVVVYMELQLFFRYGGFLSFKLLLLGVQTHPNNFVCLIVPLKSMRSL